MSAYRGGPRAELNCPRCRQRLPPLDVATCACGGVWVSAFAASEVLTDAERRVDALTRWWRVRAPCPECGDKMLLRGDEPGLFQGCDLHGYFIDADVVAHTSLANGIDHAALDAKRNDEERVAAERDARERAALERARERAEIERREAELARGSFVRPSDVPDHDRRGVVSAAAQRRDEARAREQVAEQRARERREDRARELAAEVAKLVDDDAELVKALTRATNEALATALVERLARIERELRALRR